MRSRKNKNKKESIYKMGSIASFDEFSSANFVASAVGYVDNDGFFCDVLDKNHEKYQVFLNPIDASNALKSGLLKINKPYCYSLYSYEHVFPKLDSLKTNDEKISYLKEYNEKNDVALIWTFMDKDEIEKLEKKAKKLISNDV